MSFIVETPNTHPGQRLYICRQESSRRKPVYDMKAFKDKAEKFPDRDAADLARMQFSSLYGLIITEVA
jgi:hypothetical protein